MGRLQHPRAQLATHRRRLCTGDDAAPGLLHPRGTSGRSFAACLMADDEQQLLAAARALPLDERLEHKSWKARAEALDDIKAKCERAPEVVAQAGEWDFAAVRTAGARVRARLGGGSAPTPR